MNNKKNILIGGAWPYANNSLHVGHLAALLPGDVIARYHRLIGNNVIYVSGTDSHGTPITERAKKEHVEPISIASKYHEEFSKNFKDLNFSYDLYTKTYDDYHKKQVQEYFLTILKNGYIYEKETEQDFCENCNSYLSDRELEGICPICGSISKGDQCDNCLTSLDASELTDKRCKTCGQKTITKKNKHLYLKLSAFQEVIQKLVSDNESIWRINAVNESKKYLLQGLHDRAATRNLDWGIDVPVEGYEDKKIYVWIEAVLGYLTTAKRYSESINTNFDDFIKDKGLISYYVHGKDNIPFHTIIFPALINSINKDYGLPTYIISSEYVNMNDEKMSKSKGNLITANELINNYATDTIRYYMIKNNPEKRDVNFSNDDLIVSHNKHLVGEFGNFVNRNLSYLVKKFDGIIPTGIMNEEIKNITVELYKEIGSLIEKGELRSAFDKIFEYVSMANKYYDNQKPWIQVNENIEEFNNTTFTCVNMMVNLANLFEPFIPQSAAKLRNMLNIDKPLWEYSEIVNHKLNNVSILFERIDNK